MLKDKIKSDSVIALKNHDPKRVEVLRYLVSLIDKKALQLPPEQMTEGEEVAVLRKEQKNKEESKEMFLKGGRKDLVEQMDYEIRVLKEYLPQEMGEEEVKQIIEEVLQGRSGEVGEKANFGMVMGAVMKKVAGRVGGEVVSRLVRERLGNT